MKKKLVATLALLPIFSAFALRNSGDADANMRVIPVSHFDNVTSAKQIYFLPKTVVKIKVVAVKKEIKPGPFYKYAEQFLGIKDVAVEPTVIWSMNKIELSTKAVADVNKAFCVEYSGKSFAPYISLTESGILTGVNVKRDNSPKNVTSDNVKVIENIESKVMEVPLLEEQLLAISSAKMAEETAKIITQIRQNRIALISGDVDKVPADGKSMEISLKMMDELEKKYVSLFTGQVSETFQTFIIDYMPDSIADRDVAFRFSKFSGVVPANDLSGSPYYISVRTVIDNKLPSKAAIVQKDRRGNIIPQTVAENGFFCNKPVLANISISYGLDNLVTKECLIPQLGQLISLPTTLFNSNNAIYFYPETGALMSVENKETKE